MVCFQAEDGIRELVRSRGLGDVYKRQVHVRLLAFTIPGDAIRLDGGNDGRAPATIHGPNAVSYTHLTLPTSDLV